MQKKALLWLIFGLSILELNAQILQPNYIRKNLHIHTDTSIVNIVIIEEDINIHTRLNRTYYWYKNRQIITNQGGVGGNLLDGTYKCFSKTDRLLEEGTFKKGLKTGLWKNWDIDGNLKQTHHYRKGKIRGKSTLYNNDGTVITAKYRNGVPTAKKIPFYIWWKKEHTKDSIVVTDTVPIQTEQPKMETNQPNVIKEVEPEPSIPVEGNEIIKTEPAEEKKVPEVKSRRRRPAESDNNTEGIGE
jgi:hypothetical protein